MYENDFSLTEALHGFCIEMILIQLTNQIIVLSIVLYIKLQHHLIYRDFSLDMKYELVLGKSIEQMPQLLLHNIIGWTLKDTTEVGIYLGT